MSEPRSIALSKAMELVKSIGEEPAKQFARAGFIEKTPVGDYVGSLLADMVPLLAGTPLENTLTAINPDRDAVVKFFKEVFFKTAMVTAIVSEDAAEVISEAASEAFSNAIYSGWAGAVDALVRLLVGGMPPQDLANDIALYPPLLAFMDALAGYHYHATAISRLQNMVQGLRDDLLTDNMFRALLDSVTALSWRKLRIWARLGEIYDSMIMRLAESVAAVLEHLFARAEDAANEYLATKTLYEEGLVSEAEYNAAKNKVLAELDAIEDEIDAVIADLKSALEEWTPQTIAYMQQFVQNLHNMLLSAEADMLDAFTAYLKQLYNLRKSGRPKGYYLITMQNGSRKAISVGGEVHE